MTHNSRLPARDSDETLYRAGKTHYQGHHNAVNEEDPEEEEEEEGYTCKI